MKFFVPICVSVLAALLGLTAKGHCDGAMLPEDLALPDRGVTYTGPKNYSGAVGAPPVVNDGSLRTGYAWAYLDVPLLVTFPTAVTMKKIEIVFSGVHGSWYRYIVEGSLDGKKWAKLGEKQGGEPRGYQAICFPKRECRYVRVKVTDTSFEARSYHIEELAAYNQSDPTQPTPLQRHLAGGPPLAKPSGEKARLWPGMKLGKPMSEGEFFSALNLELPGLVKVKTRVAEEDWKGARLELYNYFRDRFRKAQYFEVSMPEDPENDADFQRTKKRADDLAFRGVIVSQETGRVHQFDPAKAFDFADYNPTRFAFRTSIQIYSMIEIHSLRYMYFLTGEPAYVNRAKEMVASYCHWFSGGASTPLAWRSWHGGANSRNPWDVWCTPHRMMATGSFMTFLQKTDLEPDLVVDFMKVFLEDMRLHIRRLPRFGGNWIQFMCRYGIGPAAMFFEFKDAQGWVNALVERMLKGGHDLMPDGSMHDLSTSYTQVYVTSLQVIAKAITGSGGPIKLEIPPDLARKYESAIDWVLAMRKPDGRNVLFNDSVMASQKPSYFGSLAGDLFDYFGREDLRWFATEGKEGRPPHQTSFPPTSTTPSYAGMYAMRSDWGKDARYLVVDFGPLGGHCHADYGSFILHAYGADLIEDGGTAPYSSPLCGRYSVTPWAHNIIAIDGVGQKRQAKGRPPWGKPVPDSWISNEAYDYAWGRMPFETISPKLKGIVHRRAIYFAKPDYFLLLDAIDGSGKHRLRSKMQLWWDVSAEIQGATVIAQSAAASDPERGDASLRIVPLDERSAPRIIIAQTEPFYDGWVSKGYVPELTPAPAIVYEEERQLPAYYETLLYPIAPGDTPTIVTSQVPADGGLQAGVLASVAASDRDYRDEFIISHGEGKVTFSDKGVALEGKFAHLRYAGERLRRMAFIDAVELSLPIGAKQTSIRFKTPTDGYIELHRNRTLGKGQVYLDLSNRRESSGMIIETAGEDPIHRDIEVGRKTTLDP